MIRSAKALNHVKAFIKSQNIKSECGNSHHFQGKGDVTFHFQIGEVKNIKDVFYVFDLHNLFIFVKSLTDKGLIAIFNINECLLLNKQGVVVARRMRERNGLYKLETTIVASETCCV